MYFTLPFIDETGCSRPYRLSPMVQLELSYMVKFLTTSPLMMAVSLHVPGWYAGNLGYVQEVTCVSSKDKRKRIFADKENMSEMRMVVVSDDDRGEFYSSTVDGNQFEQNM